MRPYKTLSEKFKFIMLESSIPIASIENLTFVGILHFFVFLNSHSLLFSFESLALQGEDVGILKQAL